MNLVTCFVASALFSLSAMAGGPCPEMDRAATAMAKINGATYASPSYRYPEVPTKTELGEEYHYQFYAKKYELVGDIAQAKTVGIITAKALRKEGETVCKVLELVYAE